MESLQAHVDLRKIFAKYIYLVLIIPILIVAFPLLTAGLIINGDFPVLDTGEFAADKLTTWVANGSYPTIETLPRFPIISFWYLLNSMGIDVEAGGKIMIILGFTVASYSFYVAFLELMRDRIANPNLQLKIAAIIGSIIYAYNVWSFIRIGHWYLWIGYGLLPLFIFSTVNSISRGHPEKWKYIILSSFLWSLASATPHMAVFYGIIYVGIFSVYLLKNYVKKQSFYRLIVPFSSILLLFTLVNFYWIYPVVLSGSEEDLAPPYVLTEEMGGILSRNSSILNTIRLIADWTGLEKYDVPANEPLHPVWLFSSFVIPIVAISALLVRRAFIYSLIFSVILLIGIVLAMGTRSPLAYYPAIFLIPFGWLFRDPDKWSFLIALGYSFLAGIAVNALLHIGPIRQKYVKCLTLSGSISFIIICICLYVYPIYDSTLGHNGKYSPILVPSEFHMLNSYLSNVNTSKVFLMPYPASSTTWSNGHLVENMYPTFSSRPNIMVGNPGVSDPLIGNYYRYIAKMISDNRSSNIENYFYPFGTSYIAFHNDTDGFTYKNLHASLLNRLNHSEKVENLENFGFFKLFKVGGSTEALPLQAGILGQSIVAVQGLDKLTSLSTIPTFSSINSSLLFLDHSMEKKDGILHSENILIPTRNITDLAYSFMDDKYIISPYTFTIQHYPLNAWSKAGTMDPLHGEFHPYLEQIGIENWDFDFGKGIVMTQAIGAKLDIPFEVSTSGAYDIAMRYLNNQKGGELRLSLDNRRINELDTTTDRANRFVWNDLISNVNLTKGEHLLSIENMAGFNAVNLFAILPTVERERLIDDAYMKSNNTRIVYVLEGESNFFTDNQLPNGSDQFIMGGLSGYSNGTVLVLSPGSEAFTEMDIIKQSNYTLAVRTSSCDSCLPLNVSVEDEIGNDVFASRSTSVLPQTVNNTGYPGMEWQYLNGIDLHRGTYKFKIHSDSLRDMDLFLLYSSDGGQIEPIDELFVTSQNPAYIQQAKKLDTTKYSVNIFNATGPYTLSFAESFNPTWHAQIESADGSTSINSLPLYSVQNGFYIDMLGNYTITIVDENEELFYTGVTVSLGTLIVCVIVYTIFIYIMPRRLPKIYRKIFHDDDLTRK